MILKYSITTHDFEAPFFILIYDADDVIPFQPGRSHVAFVRTIKIPGDPIYT